MPGPTLCPRRNNLPGACAACCTAPETGDFMRAHARGHLCATPAALPPLARRPCTACTRNVTSRDRCPCPICDLPTYLPTCCSQCARTPLRHDEGRGGGRVDGRVGGQEWAGWKAADGVKTLAGSVRRDPTPVAVVASTFWCGFALQDSGPLSLQCAPHSMEPPAFHNLCHAPVTLCHVGDSTTPCHAPLLSAMRPSSSACGRPVAAFC